MDLCISGEVSLLPNPTNIIELFAFWNTVLNIQVDPDNSYWIWKSIFQGPFF